VVEDKILQEKEPGEIVCLISRYASSDASRVAISHILE
jgi:hypothetical protein